MTAPVPERWLRMGALGQTEHPGELEWHMAELTLAPVLADLRDQVEALPTVEVDGSLYVGMVWFADVLALLDGGEQ